jgi:hypothetical protein
MLFISPGPQLYCAYPTVTGWLVPGDYLEGNQRCERVPRERTQTGIFFSEAPKDAQVIELTDEQAKGLCANERPELMPALIQALGEFTVRQDALPKPETTSKSTPVPATAQDSPGTVIGPFEAAPATTSPSVSPPEPNALPTDDTFKPAPLLSRSEVEKEVHVAPAAPDLKPGARAIAAAYDLLSEGQPVSLRAACRRAKVDRGNLKKNYPEAVRMIEGLSLTQTGIRRGVLDRRTGVAHPVDEASAEQEDDASEE